MEKIKISDFPEATHREKFSKLKPKHLKEYDVIGFIIPFFYLKAKGKKKAEVYK